MAAFNRESHVEIRHAKAKKCKSKTLASALAFYISEQIEIIYYLYNRVFDLSVVPAGFFQL
jgi:hypothetical protein